MYISFRFGNPPSLNRGSMIKTYLKTALRNILRHPFFSVVNILALSISLSFCLIVLTIIRGQFEFDSFHKDRSRIFRVISAITDKNKNQFRFATTPAPLCGKLKMIDPSIEQAAGIRRMDFVRTTCNGKSLDFNAVFAGSDLFRIFSFSLSPAGSFTSLDEPNKLIMSREAADKLFGKKNVVGQVVKIDNLGSFAIAGIIDMRGIKSHLNYDLYLSASSLPALEASHKIDPLSGNWKNYQSDYTYIKVRTGKSSAQKSLDRLSAEVSARLGSRDDEKNIRFSLQSLSGITPSHGYYLDNSSGITYKTIYIIAIIVFVLLCLICFNYSNITVARALTRTREIGVRKVMGASRKQIFAQFLIESVIITLISTVFAGIIIPFIPLNDSLANLFYGARLDAGIMLIFFCFAVFAGILAGLIPAVLLSRLRAIQVLKNLSGLKIFKVALLNRVLTITQFAVSGIVMIVLFTMFRQSRYMENGNYGFDPRGIINIPVAQSLSYEGLASELSSIPGVQRISAISSNFGYHSADYCKVTREGEPLQMETACYFIDKNVIANFNLHLLAGEDFWKDAPASQQNRIIINEESARMLGFKDPGTAVGNNVRVDDSLKLIITGVVRDFHFENFKHLITPLIFRYDRSRVRYLNLKTDPLKFAAIAAAIRNKFIQLGLEPPAGIAGMDSRLRGEQAHAGDVMFVLYISYPFHC
jgi:putative ABC transport system permease protein